jgi:hypothetical protein
MREKDIPLFHLLQSINEQIASIRTDIRQMDSSQRVAMDSMENRIMNRIGGLESTFNQRVGGLETRVTKLEDEDKNIIRSNAKAGGVTGGITGALVAGGVELIKAFAGKF